jgi:hypothetical protein
MSVLSVPVGATQITCFTGTRVQILTQKAVLSVPVGVRGSIILVRLYYTIKALFSFTIPVRIDQGSVTVKAIFRLY